MSKDNKLLQDIAIARNTKRIEKARMMEIMFKEGKGEKYIMRELNCSRSTVTRHRSLLRMPSVIRSALERGGPFTMDHANDLFRLKKNQHPDADLAYWVNMVERDSISASEMVTNIITMYKGNHNCKLKFDNRIMSRSNRPWKNRERKARLIIEKIINKTKRGLNK